MCCFHPRLAPTLLVLLAAAGATHGAGLAPGEATGKAIYTTGESPSGEAITALMGEAGLEVPAGALPCVNCHGEDGHGVPEGGVIPSDITWEALTKPYGVRHASGREHPAYTERFLKRAIAMGIDPAGNRLQIAMPRYRMTLEDMDALVAYLLRLGQDRDPGVAPDRLVIGTFLPPASEAAALGEALRSVLAAFFAELDASGGLYGRRLELRTLTLPADRGAWPAAAASFLEEEQPFALVGAFVAGAEEEMAELAAARGVPSIAPFTLHPRPGAPPNRQVFYLFAGLAAQARAMAAFAVERHRGERPAAVLLRGQGDELEAAAAALAAEVSAAAWAPLDVRPSPGGDEEAAALAEALAAAGTEVVFFLAREEPLVPFLAAAERLAWHPEVVAAGTLVGRAAAQAPTAFRARLFLTYPSLPGDHSREGLEDYRRLAAAHPLPRHGLAAQLSTLAAARLLVEGLQRAGREVSREKLIAALEGLYDFQTGLTPPLTYDPNRRIGARGAYVVTLDPESGDFRPASGWIEVK